MQQAARASDYTAFLYLGELIEFDETETIFTQPGQASRPRTTSPGASAEALWSRTGDARMASEHIVKSYDEELERLKQDHRRDGRAWRKASSPPRSRPSSSATPISRRRSSRPTTKVDQLERDLDNLAVRLLALRQPMARDLREVVAALKIASDLERICDYAANVAKRSIALVAGAADPAGACAAAHGAVSRCCWSRT